VTPYVRRLIAIAAVGAALFTVSACADVPQNEPSASASAAPSATKAALADKKTSCDAYKSLDAETQAKLEPLSADLATAQSDPVKALGALTQVKALISEQEAKLAVMTNQAGDAEVKVALQTRLTEVRKLKADLDAAGTDPVKLQAVFESVDDKKSDPVKVACA
jgi:predicted  nucleic acid-binding Zn-ribbon protein